MRAAMQAFDYTKRLQECLTKHLKIFEKDIHPSHNTVYNAIIKRKIKFIKWILKAIKSYPDIEFELLITMIDSEIIICKDKLEYCKKYNRNPADYMTVIPVPFNPEAKNMLIHTKELLEYEKRALIGINSKFDKLIVALRTAVSDDSGKLDKESTSYDDLLDAFRLALRHFRIKPKETQKPIILTNS